MIKGPKHCSGIVDEKIIDFLSKLKIEYRINRISSSYCFVFFYKSIAMEFETTISFEEFIKQFVERFYKLGYERAVDEAHSKMSDVMYTVYEDMQHNWEKLLERQLYMCD